MAKIENDFLVKYRMADNIRTLKGFNVNSFTQIGLEDPFPDDDKFIAGSLDDVDKAVYLMPKVPTDYVYQDQRYI